MKVVWPCSSQLKGPRSSSFSVGLARLAELVVQADAEAMQVVLRIVARRRRGEREAAQSEVGVEILGACRPALIEAIVDAGARHVTEPDVAGIGVLVAGREVGARVARARPGDAAGDERRPRSHGIAGAAAQGRQPFELLVGRAGAGGAIGQDLREVLGAGEGRVELDAQHQARGEVLLVARLHAAEESAVTGDAAGRGNAGRIAQGGVGVAEHVADMTAEIESRARRHRIGGDRRQRRHQHGRQRRQPSQARSGFSCRPCRPSPNTPYASSSLPHLGSSRAPRPVLRLQLRLQ